MGAATEKQAKQAKKASTGVTPVTDWKKTALGHELEVPSGNTALVRRLGLATLMKMGKVPNSLMKIISKAISDGGIETPTLKDILGDESQLQDLFKMIDDVVVMCVIQPKVHAIPMVNGPDGPEEGEREDDKLYVDEVEEDDKMFIFQWVTGGTRDLEQFRHEQEAGMAELSPGAVDGVSSK